MIAKLVQKLQDGDHLTNTELLRLYHRYMKVIAATMEFPEYILVYKDAVARGRQVRDYLLAREVKQPW